MYFAIKKLLINIFLIKDRDKFLLKLVYIKSYIFIILKLIGKLSQELVLIRFKDSDKYLNFYVLKILYELYMNISNKINKSVYIFSV